MAHLNEEHIAYIRKDLHYRGIVVEGIESELLDHICSAVEAEMEKGERFITAYHNTLHAFGHGHGLRAIQRSTIKATNPHPMMLRHYITIALRNSKKHSLFTFINVAGLSMGVAAFLLILMLLVNELSFDRYHENADRIVRLTSETIYNGNVTRSVNIPSPAAKILSQEFPEVEAAGHIGGQGLFFVKREGGKENIKVERCTVISNDLFKVLTIPFVAGDPATALTQPNTVVVSETTAKTLFGDDDPLNQPIVTDNWRKMTVVGVYKNFPQSSHLQMNMLISEVGDQYYEETDWVVENLTPRAGTKTYVLLREGSDAKAFEQKLNTLIQKYIEPSTPGVIGKSNVNEAGESLANSISFGIQPLKGVHLDASFQGDFTPAFDMSYVYILAAVGLFIICIASINFVNLSTARSSNRAKEVGMRKVMGSLRGYLVRQFLIESVVLSSIAVLIALGLAWLLLPSFNSMIGYELVFPWKQPLFYVIAVGGALVLGILAGLYPSIFLSSFKPAQVLKGTIALGIRGGSIRSALVVSQFAISIFLVIGTIVLFRQMSFINNRNLGFNREQIITVQETYLLRNNKRAYKDEVMKSSVFTHATISGFLPAAGPWRLPRSWWRAGDQNSSTTTVQDWSVDADYIPTLGMRVKAGRNFNKESAADSTAVLINETAMKALGLSEDVIGQTLTTYRDYSPRDYRSDNLRTFTIVGVVEDFHFESMKTPIGPIVFRVNNNASGTLVFRFEAGKADEAIAVLDDLWKKLAPGEPLTYVFMEEGFSNMYTSEKKLSEIFGMFTIVALAIACLGLFALITFTTEQRKKEVGIRKVMGASVSDIVFLFSKELGKLILVAFVLAVPLAWYTVEWWLESYNYRIEVGPLIYIVAGGFAIAIAWLTTGFQSLRSATANPAEALRSE